MKQSIILEAEKARNIRFGINALCKAEEMLGKPITKINEDMGISEMRILLYCGLYWEDKELTLEGAGEVMDEVIANKGIEYLTEKFKDAIELSLNPKKK